MTTKTNTAIVTKDAKGYVDGIVCGHNHSGPADLVLVGRDAECVGCLGIYTLEELRDAVGRPGQRGTGRLYDQRAC